VAGNVVGFTLAIDGVAGGQARKIRSFNWAVQAEPEGGVESAADDVLIARDLDQHSPNYLQKLVRKNGSNVFPNAVIKGTLTSKNSFTIKLTQVLISSYEIDGGPSHPNGSEQFTLHFEKMHFKYTDNNAGGPNGQTQGDYVLGE
jgi:type VI protein secretion system component Hcp